MSLQSQWDALKMLGLPDKGAAVVMGHAKAESGNETNRVQGDFDPMRIASREYTARVDHGEITREDFTRRGPGGGGYGWLQWTFPARKEGYYDNAKKRGVSIGSQEAAVSWLWQELQQKEFEPVRLALFSDRSIREISDVFLHRFEMPADQTERACVSRAKMCQDMYDTFAGSTPDPEPEPEPERPVDLSVLRLQAELRENGYETPLDGVKTKEFLDLMAEFVEDMRKC